MRHAHQQRRVDAVEAPHLLVGVGADQVGVHAHDRGRQVVGDRAQPALAVGQVELGLLARGDVERHHVVAVDAAGGVEVGHVADHEHRVGMLAHAAAFEMHRVAGQRLPDVGRQLVAPGLAHHLGEGAADEGLVRHAEQRLEPRVGEAIGLGPVDVGDVGRHVVGDRAQAALAEREPRAALHQRGRDRGARLQLAQDVDRAAGHHRHQQQQDDAGIGLDGMTQVACRHDALGVSMALGGDHRRGKAPDVAPDLGPAAVEHDGTRLPGLRGRQRDRLVEAIEVRLHGHAQARHQLHLLGIVAHLAGDDVEIAPRAGGVLLVARQPRLRAQQDALLRRFGVERRERHGLHGGHARARALGPAGRLVEAQGLLVDRPGNSTQDRDADGGDECKRALQSRGG